MMVAAAVLNSGYQAFFYNNYVLFFKVAISYQVWWKLVNK